MKTVKNRKEGECAAKRCKNKPVKKDRFCPRCRHRYQKEHNTVSYVYSILKSNAKRRCKTFTISLSYFKSFCKKKGYEPGNLQVLSLRENAVKGCNETCPF